jgi:CheY-like chemotaxis protein
VNNKRLLVVEDDPDGQEVVARMLRHYHIAADVVYTAEDALDMLATYQYSGAVFDLALPGMDGWSLLESVQSNADTAALPCVAITAYHSADVAVKAIEAGFVAYFPKPLETQSFVRELQRVLH